LSRGKGRESKDFFFEKKKQKTFAILGGCDGRWSFFAFVTLAID
jgi:hypothetical protein